MRKFKMLLMTAAMVALSACGGQSSAPADTNQAQENESAFQANDKSQTIEINVGDITGGEVPYAQFHIAMEKGYFEEEGIKVNKKIFASGPNMMLSLANGEIDVAMAGSAPLLQAASQGTDMKIISSITKDNAPIIARKEIKTFEELDGKVVGTPGIGTVQNTMLNLAAEKAGIKFGKLVHGKITDLSVFLEKGEIDAFIGWEWIAANTVYSKGANYVMKKPVLENAESCLIAVRGDLAKENPELVGKISRVYVKAAKFIEENPDEAIKIMAGVIKQPEEMVKMAFEAVSVTDPAINVESVKWQVEDAIKTGKIDKKAVENVDAFISQYIDTSIVEKAKQ